MYSNLLRLLNALKWCNIAEGGLERKELILIRMREVINSELKKVRTEKKALEKGDN